MLCPSWRNETKSTQLAEKILSDNQPFTLTVWKHFPQYLFDLKTFDVSLRQVVDLKSNTDVYWSVDKHNKYQKRERIAGVIAGIFFSVFVIGVDILEFYIGGYDRYRKKKQKEKTKKHRRKQFPTVFFHLIRTLFFRLFSFFRGILQWLQK